MPEKTLGWGIISSAQIARKALVPAIAAAHNARLVCVGTPNAERVQANADEFGYRVAPSYEAVLEDPEVDVVYNPLPNGLHAEWSIRAMEAGKHVLCEKPMALDSTECQRMLDAARAAGRKLMIAYRLHYEPFTQKLIEICQTRALGAIKTIATCNGQITKAPDIRLSRALGGGPVQDTGIYCINAAGYVTGEQPVSVSARAWQPADDPNFQEVPESVTFTLHYASGVLAHCDTSFGIAESRYLRVQCEKGVIDFDMAYAYRGQRLRVKRGDPGEGGAHDEELVFRPVDHFAAEMDHFSACVLDGTEPRTPGAMGLADVRVIEAIEEAVRSGATVDVARDA